jgi:hypothetical protein
MTKTPKPTTGATHAPTDITDEVLVGWFKTNWRRFAFTCPKVTHQQRDWNKEISGCIGRLQKYPLHRQERENLQQLWRLLVGCAILYLKSCDERELHHDDGDYGVEALFYYFRDFCEYEKLLYGSSEYYRDHVTHLFRVFLLGEYLLRSVNVGDVRWESIDVDDAHFSEDKKLSPDEKEAMWCLMALTHDLGYPLEVSHKINRKVGDMLGRLNVDMATIVQSQQSAELNDHIMRLMSASLKPVPVQLAPPTTQTGLDEGKKKETKNKPESEPERNFHTQLQPKYLWKFLRALEGHDHGIHSSILLFKSLVFFLETDYGFDMAKMLGEADARQFLIRQQVLRSVAAHNCDSIYHLRVAEFPFLLRIVDEMQEWSRPSIAELFAAVPEPALKIISFTPSNVAYCVEFAHADGSQTPSVRKRQQLDVAKYFQRQTKKYVEILRSAAFGARRNFTLRLEVNDGLDTGKPHTYVFEQTNAADMTVKWRGMSIQLHELDERVKKLEKPIKKAPGSRQTRSH